MTDWREAAMTDDETAVEMVLCSQLLGGMWDPLPAWRAASEILAAEDWQLGLARRVYEGLAAADEEGEQLGHPAVLKHARERGVDEGLAEFVGACRDIWCTELAPDRCRGMAVEIRAAALRRRAERMTQRLVEDLHIGVDFEDALGAHQTEMRDISETLASGVARPDELAFARDDLEQLAEHGYDPRQVRLGFAGLDRKLWVYPGSLTVVAGPTGCGKSTLAAQVAENIGSRLAAAGLRERVLMILLEMSEREVQRRRLLSQADMTRRALMDKSFHDWRQRLVDAESELRRRRVELFYDAPLTPMRLRSVVRGYADRSPVRLLILDYLQAMAPNDPKSPRERQVAEAAQALKELAIELDMPVVAVSSFSREASKATEPRGKTRERGEPELHHLRDSGNVEYWSDNVVLMNPKNPKDTGLKIVELRIAKQRNGPLARSELTLNGPLHRFEEREEG